MFRAMSISPNAREAGQIRSWANVFPYVNGRLFSASEDGRVAVPRFSKIARSYLLHVGNLDWTKINPDIFGSMIQAVAEFLPLKANNWITCGNALRLDWLSLCPPIVTMKYSNESTLVAALRMIPFA